MTIETDLIHEGFIRSQFDESSEPIYMTSGFVYKTAQEAEAAFNGSKERHQYSRFSNPTLSCFEERLAKLEKAETCIATASGMAAVYGALAGLCKAGDRIVACRAMFGSCLQIITKIMPQYGVDFELVDGTDIEQWKQALSKPTDIVFIESPSNPMLDVVDLPAVAKLAKQAGALVLVDNVFATPLGQRPLELGADLVIYSATKHIDGQGRALGGAVLASSELLDAAGGIRFFIRNTGLAMSPFNAWIMLKSLETLPVRIERQAQNATKIADFLSNHPAISQMLYPFHTSHPQYTLAKKLLTTGGNMISFTLKGGKKAAFEVQNSFKLFLISNNLGDSKSLSTHPSSTTHYSIGAEARAGMRIDEGTIRLSIGLEHSDDLIADLKQALNAIGV
ncbi:MAG: O-succinylhomoserine sulfhydrylase [Alphaproteobacteria bacterium]|jgi:O-succinylhomoserine sulfhydrylase